MSIYNFKVKDAKGEELDLSSLKGKVVLIVNIASKCGLTPQLADLEDLNRTYKGKDLVILGFPCDQFLHQSPESDEQMVKFCSMNYEVSFPVLGKIEVNGDNTAPLYQYLKSEKSGFLGSKIKWNFTKFLIGKNGEVYKRYAPTKKPAKLTNEIEKLLQE